MIPYLTLPPVELGGLLRLQPFGLLVATGCLVGYAVARWHATSVGLEPRAFYRLIVWLAVPTFLFTHWLSLLLYAPDLLRQQPLLLLTFKGSMSSYGGFLGAAVG